MSNLFKRFYFTSLFFKIASIVFVSVALVSICTTALTIKISKDVLVDTFSRSNYKVLTQISESFARLNDKTLNIMNVISISPDFENYLTYTGPDNKFTYNTIYKMKKHLMETVPANDFNDFTVVIVGVNGRTHVVNNDRITSEVEDILEYDISKNALNNKNTVLYQYLEYGFTSLTRYKNTIVATKVLTNKITKEPYGFVYILITQDVLKNYYAHFVGAGSNISIIASDGTVVSSNIISQVGKKNLDLYEISKDIQSNNKSYINTKMNSDDITILSKYLPVYNFNIVGTINKNMFLSEMYNTSEIILVSGGISLIFIIITFFTIQKSTKSISDLVEKIPHIIHGDFNNHISVDGSYETRELSIAFNYMLDGLNSYVQKQVKLEKEKRKAEIHALQMQINPHFIYNTLSSVKWLMWQGNVEKSIDTIDAFISLLQNTISNKNEMITILEEINNIKNYVLIHHIRYGDDIIVNFFVMPQCEEYIIPKLILQPFIENSFFHGFPNKSKGYIHIFVNEIDGNLICEIIDNGIGISDENLENILEKSTNKNTHFTSIGIHNVNDRIKLLYGDNYGVTINSEIDRGTTVKVIIPAQKNFIDE